MNYIQRIYDLLVEASIERAGDNYVVTGVTGKRTAYPAGSPKGMRAEKALNRRSGDKRHGGRRGDPEHDKAQGLDADVSTGPHGKTKKGLYKYAHVFNPGKKYVRVARTG